MVHKSNAPPDLDKYIKGKLHNFVTYEDGARLYSIPYWSFVNGVYNLMERNKELLKERGNEGLEEADETLDQIFEMVKDYPDLLQKLVDAQNDYANKLECMVEATKQQLAESGEDILSDKDSVALETLQYKAKGELCELAEQLLREAFLRKQETMNAREKELKELESEYRRLCSQKEQEGRRVRHGSIYHAVS
ncbi:hypothetical protein [Butyrivibrio sp. WCE2006]|uniref:hypothetical protein n=1 Tax=Butyrivibrio sp. WCE2006 TaxID=1410611 RepID=UPI0005D1ADC9|nr:hypothetical protein [Butyrivibrio sp. WCE2006]